MPNGGPLCLCVPGLPRCACGAFAASACHAQALRRHFISSICSGSCSHVPPQARHHCSPLLLDLRLLHLSSSRFESSRQWSCISEQHHWGSCPHIIRDACVHAIQLNPSDCQVAVARHTALHCFPRKPRPTGVAASPSSTMADSSDMDVTAKQEELMQRLERARGALRQLLSRHLRFSSTDQCPCHACRFLLRAGVGRWHKGSSCARAQRGEPGGEHGAQLCTDSNCQHTRLLLTRWRRCAGLA